jgi:hypothetical protein
MRPGAPARQARLERLDQKMKRSYCWPWWRIFSIAELAVVNPISVGCAAFVNSAHTPDLSVALSAMMVSLTGQNHERRQNLRRH